MLNVGVLGAGHLGKIHLKLLQQSPLYNLVGFYDPDERNAAKVASDFGYKRFSSIAELIEEIDVLDIVTPTLSHFLCAQQAIQAGKHIFIEKPIATSVEEAEEIILLAQKYNVMGQVGHVERFNPAFLAAKPYIDSPMFIEVHRLAEFNPRGTDVPVILDLMIHDIDIVLSVVKSTVKSISSNAVEVISSSPDIATARIEFENGSVANLTASRISLKTTRKARFFQKEAYIAVDFFEKKAEVIKMRNVEQPDEFAMVLQNAEGQKKQLYFENPTVQPTNAILQELESFAKAIKTNTKPLVTLEEGAQALKLAIQIARIHQARS